MAPWRIGDAPAAMVGGGAVGGASRGSAAGGPLLVDAPAGFRAGEGDTVFGGETAEGTTC